ncbi:hypothetical protein D1AOALGA4SA_9159 [Olavius algarvensis Delta 1 endosymbiont]|nr:hypothetical protein D1AOALGA4SA_9159 [Olavius algarvensis Delta 1 endosymbiont]
MTSKLNTNDFSALDISADLTLSCGAVNIFAKADGKYIYIRFPSIRSAFSVFKFFRSKRNSTDFLTTANKYLKKAEFTIFFQNRHFAILGARANPFLLNLFKGLIKSTNLLR